MKRRRFLLLALIVLFSGCLDAQSDKTTVSANVLADDAGRKTIQGLTFHTELEPAMAEAKLQEKTVFVYLQSDYCGWCRKFEAETFTDSEVISKLEESFILLTIDVVRQKNETRNFRARGTPTSIFLDQNGTEIKRIPGYVDTVTFLNIINDIA